MACATSATSACAHCSRWPVLRQRPRPAPGRWPFRLRRASMPPDAWTPRRRLSNFSSPPMPAAPERLLNNCTHRTPSAVRCKPPSSKPARNCRWTAPPPPWSTTPKSGTAQAVIELFLTTDAGRARALAEQLHAQNAERRQVQATIVEACEKLPMDSATSALVYYSEEWHRGVLGIVASRLIELFHRPVFVLGRNADDGLVQGSGRSIPAFHLLDALESMCDLFRFEE